MTAYNCLYIIAIAFVMMIGWEAFARAADDGTAGSSSSGTLAPDGTPVVHKSLHKKKKSTTASTGDTPASVASAPSMTAAAASAPVITVPKAPASTLTISKAIQPGSSTSLGPTVETGMPVAKHSDLLGSTTVPAPTGLQNSASYRSTVASSLPSISTPGSTTSTSLVSSYSAPARTTSTTTDFVFTNFPKKPKNNYPWKTGIYTTMFWIGEGGSSLSNTDNKASSFDANWVDSNHGTDNPNDRNGYSAGSHASTVNPFYVALPFNDLVYPDKARQWLPAGWHRPNKDGKPVSACKDRWVEIKAEDGSGHVCYAQWEDVGPLRYDHAEYVFGSERPDTYTRAGLDVSPAVADYLNLNGQKHPMTRWRFVDDEDVQPGQWLKLDEQAVIYDALHHKSANQPIQRASEPIDDPSDIDGNKKKVGAAKG